MDAPDSPWPPLPTPRRLTRRDFLKTSLIGAAAASLGLADSATPSAQDRVDLHAADGCRHIYGFNYQPSWGHDGPSVWGKGFDPSAYRRELTVGRKYFPKFNTVRIWLSWNTYRRDPERSIRNYRQAIAICGEVGLLAMPVIFSRWLSWERVTNEEIVGDFDATFGPYLRALIPPLSGDRRILAWDLCNEPFGSYPSDKGHRLPPDTEAKWLRNVGDAIKRLDPAALICVGTMPSFEQFERCADFQDILTPHLYYPTIPTRLLVERRAKGPWPVNLSESHSTPDLIAKCVDLAKRVRKPLLSTECCWGALDDDAERVVYIRANLQLLKDNGIGFLPHALYTSEVKDLHPGGLNMPFILADGSLRPGHGVYNEFTG